VEAGAGPYRPVVARSSSYTPQVRLPLADSMGGGGRAKHLPRPFRLEGEDGRLRAVVEENRHALGRYLAHVGVPHAELDDAMQETFLVVAARLATLPLGAERPFLFATASRIAGNARRGLRRRERARDRLLHAPVDPPPAVDDAVDRLHARAMVEDALEEMPTESVLVFILAELHEMAPADIADRLGLPGGTVASRLRRARRSFDEWAGRVGASAAFDESRPMHAARGARREVAGDPEILSWWVSPGEVDALSALLRVYERAHPDGGVVSAAVAGNAIVREQVRKRMTRGVPPDTFQVNGGIDLFAWARRSAMRERLEPIDCLFASEGWDHAFPSDVLDLVRHEGRLYGVPLDIHRTNALFFSRPILAKHGLLPPTTLDDLHVVAEALRARGVVPFAIGYKQPWTLTMLAFESVLVAVAGGEYYRDLFSGRCRPGGPELRATLAHVARILDYANADAARLGWDGAVELLRNGRAAMTIMGDWAKGYLTNSGSASYRDFGEVASPGAGGAFIFATDTFGLPKRASHRAGAIDLLKVFGSREGQDAFNPIKGSISARTDVDLSFYDPIARATARDFWASARYPSLASIAPGSFIRALDAAMAKFARNRDPEAVIAAIRAHYDLLVR
jgi:glucose/mannose transport system substrate-binding protein